MVIGWTLYLQVGPPLLAGRPCPNDEAECQQAEDLAHLRHGFLLLKLRQW